MGNAWTCERGPRISGRIADAVRSRLEIVEAYDGWHPGQIAKGAFVEAEKCREPLIPDGFFVAVSGTGER